MQEKLVNISKDENLPDLSQQDETLKEEEKSFHETQLDKKKLVNVDKNEAYKAYIEQEGAESSSSINEQIASYKTLKKEIASMTKVAITTKAEIDSRKAKLERKQSQKNQEEL